MGTVDRRVFRRHDPENVCQVITERASPISPQKLIIWKVRLVRPLRYLFVGAACAALNNIIIIGANWFGYHYALSTIAALLLVTPFGFWLHSRFTFDAALSWRSLGTFFLGVAAGFPLSLSVMAVLCSALHVKVIFAAPLTTGILFAWNYVSARLAITGVSSFQSLG